MSLLNIKWFQCQGQMFDSNEEIKMIELAGDEICIMLSHLPFHALSICAHNLKSPHMISCIIGDRQFRHFLKR